MIVRPSPPDDDIRRLEALYRLASHLDGRAPPDVSWRYGKVPPYNLIGLRLSAGETAGELVVLPVWFLGPHRNDFVPFPRAGESAYQVLQLHWREEPDGPPYAYEHLITGDQAEVLASVLRWKSEGPRGDTAPVPPIGEDDVSRLRVIAAAASEPPELVVEFDPAAPPAALTPDVRASLAEDLSHVSREALSLHIPRDDRGRLALGAAALLTSYESEEDIGGKRVWLAALTPERRRDPQVIRLGLRTLAGGPYAHIWDTARWLWDTRAVNAPESERWGVEGLEIDMLGLEDRSERIRDLGYRVATGGTLAEHVALCILLQDEGRIEEAFALFEITLSEEVVRLLHGLPIAGYLGSKLPSWVAHTREQLRQAAPWLMPAVLTAEAERRMTLRTKPKRPPYFRLCALPHQSSVAKTSLMLVAGARDGGDPSIELEHTGWDYRLPEPGWKRPLEIDLRRFGLL